MKAKILPLTFTLIVVMTIAAFAHGGATGIVKERMDGMVAMGKAMKSVAEMFKGNSAFDAKQIGAASDIVLQHAKNIEKLFPNTEASRNGKGTGAIPAVWEDRENFLAIATELEKRASDLKQVADGGDQIQIRTSFGMLSKSCASCHKNYRKKKE